MSEIPIKVLCVDDHPLIRDGIAFALQPHSDIQLVASASNGREAVEMFERYLPDVTLVDLQLPDISGIEVILRIRETYPQARFVVLTTYSGDVRAARALKAGAMGYLLKSMMRKELIDTIRLVHSGAVKVAPQVASNISEHYGNDALTARELEVLRSVAGGNSNKLVGSELGIAEETVKGHMRTIMMKLQANDRTHAILIALQRGYLEG
jgi:DNA-binding NarL/FixJ family response regulator